MFHVERPESSKAVQFRQQIEGVHHRLSWWALAWCNSLRSKPVDGCNNYSSLPFLIGTIFCLSKCDAGAGFFEISSISLTPEWMDARVW